MATINTLRVYIGAYFDTTVSVLVFLSVAVSTSDNILLTVEFLYMEVTFTSIKPLLLILPDNTSLPMVAFNNSDSPVRALVSSIAFPSIIIPSSGTFSPSFTTIISLTFMVSVGTTFIVSSSFKLEFSSFIFISSDTDFLLLLTANFSSAFPSSYRNITISPSCSSPNTKAPIVDITINRFSLIIFLDNCLIAVIKVLYTNTI